MIRRYDLERSDNLPYTGRKAYTCSGNGFIDIHTGFPVRAATITWSSLPTYDAPFEMSSSSSSTSSSSSIDSSSSSSSSSQSSSSSTSLSSSSSSESSPSSESNGNNSSSSSSHSESSGGYEDSYCMLGNFLDSAARGTYSKNGSYFHNRPVYSNGTYYLYYHIYDPSWSEWVVDSTIADGNIGIIYSNLIPYGEFPDSQTYIEYASSIVGTAIAGPCSSSSSSSSVYSTSSSSESSESVNNISSSTSSSSQSSGYGFSDNYCLYSTIWDQTINGTYSRTGSYYNDRPVFSNGTYYMYYSMSTQLWTVSSTIVDPPFGWAATQVGVNGILPDTFQWTDLLIMDSVSAIPDFCPSSSSSESSSSSSTSNEYYGPFKVPRIYVWSYLSNGFRVRYENIPEEIGFVEFAYFAV